MRNWFIKQIFYIKYWLRLFPYARGKGEMTFYNSGLHDGQWTTDNAIWPFTKTFRQKYGLFRFMAVLNGEITDKKWPALWMLNDKKKYLEIDIELMKNSKGPYLVYTVWINNNSNISEKAKVKRIKYKKKSFIQDVIKRPLEYIIEWREKEIRFYIFNILTGVVRMSPDEEMWLAAGQCSLILVEAFELKIIKQL